MKRRIKLLIFTGTLIASSFLVNCGDEDILGSCAGCDSSAPWSVFGSDDCYETRQDCEALEKGDCVVCT